MKIVKVQVFGSIGYILIGLAMYAIFGANGDAFHPLLNNMDVVYSMLLIGGVIAIWDFVTFLKLIREKNKLQGEP